MTLPRPHRDVVTERVGDDLVIVHLGTNEIFSLNATAARFWELLVKGSTRDTIEEQLAAEYEVDRVELEREIDQLLLDLQQRRMVQPD